MTRSTSVRVKCLTTACTQFGIEKAVPRGYDVGNGVLVVGPHVCATCGHDLWQTPEEED